MNEKIAKFANKVGRKIAEKSPVILLVAGVGLIGTGTVIACRRTKKTEPIIEMAKSDISALKEAKEDGSIIITSEKEDGEIVEEEVEFTEKDYKKLRARIYIRTGLQCAKIYAPAIACEVLGITSIGVSYRIVSRRLGVAIAAATGIEESFNTYRGNVIEELGEDSDYRFLNGIKKADILEPELDKNGNPKVDKNTGEAKMKPVTVETVNPEKVASISSYLFDELNFVNAWNDDPEQNCAHINTVEAFANSELQRKGYLTLASVLEKLGYNPAIGIPKEALVIGWKLDKNNAKYQTPYECRNHNSGGIHFGHYDYRNPSAISFQNGNESSVWLNFNVDGFIYDKI